MRATEDTDSNSTASAQLRRLPINSNGHVRMPPQPAGFGAALFDLSARMASRERGMTQRATPRQFDMKLQRLAEIGDLILARTGHRKIETDDALHVALIAAHHCKSAHDARCWIWKWCPALSRDTVEAIVADAFAHPQTYEADDLAEALLVTFEERQRLGLCTIGAYDVKRKDRLAYVSLARRLGNQWRKEKQRRQAGAVPRGTGDSATAEAAALGISRRTLFNRRKKAAEIALHSNGAPKEPLLVNRCAIRVQPVAASPETGRAAAHAADPVQIAIPADTPISVMGWRQRVVMASSDPHLARIGALVAAQAAAHRLANSIRRAA